MLVDPRRYRYGGAMWLARWVGKIIPKPDLWILLDAPAEVLQKRKQEVPPEETARQRRAYLCISHDLKGVRTMADEVIVMRAGRVVEQGAAAEVFENPKQAYTRALIAAAFDIEAVEQDAVGD